jgi:hypothetical protein
MIEVAQARIGWQHQDNILITGEQTTKLVAINEGKTVQIRNHETQKRCGINHERRGCIWPHKKYPWLLGYVT